MQNYSKNGKRPKSERPFFPYYINFHSFSVTFHFSLLPFSLLLCTFAPPLEKAPLVDRGTGGKINCIEI